jgi:hypothetical protein
LDATAKRVGDRFRKTKQFFGCACTIQSLLTTVFVDIYKPSPGCASMDPSTM